MPEIMFLLWSNKHQMWWAPDSRGYTPNLEEAGRYTQWDALENVLASSMCMLLSQVTCMVAEAPDAPRS